MIYKKAVPASAMRACYDIAERSLLYIKAVPASAMRACCDIDCRIMFYKKEKIKVQ